MFSSNKATKPLTDARTLFTENRQEFKRAAVTIKRDDLASLKGKDESVANEIWEYFDSKRNSDESWWEAPIMLGNPDVTGEIVDFVTRAQLSTPAAPAAKGGGDLPSVPTKQKSLQKADLYIKKVFRVIFISNYSKLLKGYSWDTIEKFIIADFLGFYAEVLRKVNTLLWDIKQDFVTTETARELKIFCGVKLTFLKDQPILYA